MTVTHNVVAIGKTDFFGWPANHGIWKFNDEIHILYYYNLGEEDNRFVADTVISEWETLIK